MWGIPYKIIDRTGYNLTFLASIGERSEPPFFINDAAIQNLYNESEDVLPLQDGVLQENEGEEEEA